jgi:hypothetical protein
MLNASSDYKSMSPSETSASIQLLVSFTPFCLQRSWLRYAWQVAHNVKWQAVSL